MKKVITILWLLLACCLPAQAQKTKPVGGEVRYEHQYQDVRVGDRLTTLLRMNPALDLNLTGTVYSSGLLFYTIRTSLNTNFGSTHTPEDYYKNRQFLWNTYNANLFFFQFAPINFEIGARDYVAESKFSYGVLNSIVKNRQQEQRATLSLVRLPFFPVTHLSYRRTKSTADTETPSETITNDYTLSASSGSGSASSITMTGSLIDIADRYTGLKENMFNLQLDASKQFTEQHQLTFTSEYARFNAYRGLSGGLGYGGLLSDHVRINSGIGGKSFTSGLTSSRGFSASQGVNYSEGEDFSASAFANGGLGTDDMLVGRVRRRISTSTWTTGGTAQYRMGVGIGRWMNNVSMSYGRRSYMEQSSFWNAGFTSSLQSNVGTFLLTGTYGFTSQYMFDGIRWYVFGNNARLSATGMLPLRIRTQSNVDYRDLRDGGTIQTSRGDRSLSMRQAFDGTFHYYIPFTLSLQGGITWYMSAFRGHSYNWQATFNSPNFFTQGLYVGYTYSRAFDPYFRRENAQQTLNATYRWRALSFSLRLRQMEYVSKLRDVWFSVSRPF